MLKENLRRLRETKGISQQQLADDAGVHVAVVRDTEAGKSRMPAYDKVVRLARALGVDPEELCPLSEVDTGVSFCPPASRA